MILVSIVVYDETMFRQVLNIIVVNVIKNKTKFQLSNYEKTGITPQKILKINLLCKTFL